MADKRTREEILADIRREDESRDVPVTQAVTIAVLASVSSLAGTVACLSLGFLEIYRKDVTAFWMACTPFCYQFITGIYLAYRRQLSCIGVHITLLLATLLVGGAGYIYSIEPVFMERHSCVQVSVDRGDCDKETLLYLYLSTGAVALLFCLLGLLAAFITWSSAARRRSCRECEFQKLEQEQALRKKLEHKRLASLTPLNTLTPRGSKPTGQLNGDLSHGGHSVDTARLLGHSVDTARLLGHSANTADTCVLVDPGQPPAQLAHTNPGADASTHL
ncbi:uncharacterized protein LOC131927895 isoform X2 [Physella acuta]|nr:uncharacterized protein LOC131927895 isoform X2 [Physella acuta]